MPEFIGEIKQNGGDFALLDSSNLRGGLTQVKTLKDRDSIIADKLKINTLVFVEETNSIFRYTENGWSPFKVSDNSIRDYRLLTPSTMVTELDKDSLTLEDSIFQVGDIIGYNMQELLVGDYAVVSQTEGNVVKLTYSEGATPPAKFTELYLIGSTTDESRALALVLHKVNGAIVLSQFVNRSIDSINTTYSLRLGQEINGKWKVYADEVHLRGDFFDKRDRNISDLATVEYESLRREFGYDNLINNPSFITGFNGWDTYNTAEYFTVAGKIILTDQTLLSNATDGAYVIVEGGQTVLKLTENSSLTQPNDNLRDIVDFEAGPNTWFDVFYTYRTIEPGTLTIKLGSTIKDSFNFTSTDYKVHRASFKWDGTGDLNISCSGKVKLKSIVIRPNEVKTLIDTYNLESK